MKVIKENDFKILKNEGILTLLHATASNSIIDLAIASPFFAPLCNNYVLNDTHGSDHFPVEIRFIPSYSVISSD